MPPKRAMRRRRRTRGRSNMIPPPASSATTYRGPVRLPLQIAQNQTYNVNLMTTTSLVSTAGGVISAVIANNFNGMNESSSFATIYDEYRVLAAEYVFIFNNNNTYNSSLLQAPLITVVDRDNATALASVAAAFNYESAVLHSSGQNFTRTVRMHSVEDAAFVTTSPGTNVTWWLKMYGTGFSNSINYATVFARFLVQFRGRI